ncbi:hypothetical protein B0H15DRAFT_954410 [Mycena belliarum]|uniref:Uncharacterized protein n=1 Tax=Mycena belliarum TaxID=1033014 RepID=A0AAD6TXF8_9AGAR|nr:hypothetical protein B0H15DRAFT_954410 [Mycena belliae]
MASTSSTSSAAGFTANPSTTPSAGSNVPVGVSATALPPEGTSALPAPPPQCTDVNGCSAPPPATLYLYTFLSTLVILLLVSSCIIGRSMVLRRRQQIAIANGTWIPPHRRQEQQRQTGPKPVMFEAYVVLDGTARNERWSAIKPFSASDVFSPATAPHLPISKLESPTPARRNLFYSPFQPPPAPPPPPVELKPPASASLANEVQVAIFVAMPQHNSLHGQGDEGPPYLEFGVLNAELVESGKLSSQSDGDVGAMDRRSE